MIKQLSTITLIVAAVFATPAFAQTYNFETEFTGTFLELSNISNEGLIISNSTLSKLISGDASLFSSSLTTAAYWTLDSATGFSYCSGICNAVETLLNGDKIYSSFIDTSQFDGVDTLTFSGTSTITGGTGLFENATGYSSYSGTHKYTDTNTGITFLSVIGSITTPSVSAVPEPETYGMMMAGLGLIGFAARRKKT